MPSIKISGITNNDDAKWSAILGVEFISVSVAENSPKKISYDRAEEIRKNLPSYTSFIIETESANMNIKKILALTDRIAPNFVQIKLLPTEISDYSELNLPIILEVSLPDFVDETDYAKLANCKYDPLVHLKLSENFNMEELQFVKEKLNMEKTIIEGDWELSDIKKASEILKPFAWSIRTIIEKSPRRIDYNKMKHYIREISLW